MNRKPLGPEFWLRTGPEDVAPTASLWAGGGAVWLAEAGVPPAPALGWRDGERGAQAVALCGKPDVDRDVAAAAILEAIPRVEPGDGDDATRVAHAFTRERCPPGRHLVGRCAAHAVVGTDDRRGIGRRGSDRRPGGR